MFLYGAKNPVAKALIGRMVEALPLVSHAPFINKPVSIAKFLDKIFSPT